MFSFLKDVNSSFFEGVNDKLSSCSRMLYYLCGHSFLLYSNVYKYNKSRTFNIIEDEQTHICHLTLKLCVHLGACTL